jgi:predicted TIM-barrel enzyme
MDFKKKEIIGMIHLSGPDTVQKALEEIRIYEEEGLSGIIVENYHGSVDDVIRTLEMLKYHPTTMDVGINILPNEYKVAYDICDAFTDIKFIQLDYVAGKYKGDKSLNVDDYLKNWLPHDNLKIFGGVWPKYYTPVEGSDLETDIIEALFLVDAIVVTGNATGMETPFDKIKQFRQLMDGDRKSKLMGYKRPLIVGAGLTSDNVVESLEWAQAGIVGSAFKPNGRTHQMVDRDLVKSFMDEVAKIKY